VATHDADVIEWCDVIVELRDGELVIRERAHAGRLIAIALDRASCTAASRAATSSSLKLISNAAMFSRSTCDAWFPVSARCRRRARVPRPGRAGRRSRPSPRDLFEVPYELEVPLAASPRNGGAGSESLLRRRTRGRFVGKKPSSERTVATKPIPSRGTSRACRLGSRDQSEYSLCRAVSGKTACARSMVAEEASEMPRWRTLPASTSVFIAPKVLRWHGAIYPVLVVQVNDVDAESGQRRIAGLKNVVGCPLIRMNEPSSPR